MCGNIFLASESKPLVLSSHTAYLIDGKRTNQVDLEKISQLGLSLKYLECINKTNIRVPKELKISKKSSLSEGINYYQIEKLKKVIKIGIENNYFYANF